MRKHPIEIEEAIGKAVVAGVRTTEIYRQLRTGELLKGPAYPDFPRRTFYQTLDRARKRLLSGGGYPAKQEPDESEFIASLRKLDAEREAEIARVRRLDRDQKPQEPPSAPSVAIIPTLTRWLYGPGKPL